ncbi:MAG TPA: DUF2142 domain-containing protein, partial [bacterium]|nr:DUF2142 domain-containing protein [bacterium]
WLFVFSGLIAVSLIKAVEGDLRGFDWTDADHWPLATAVACLGLLLLHQASKAVEAWALPGAPRRVERWFLGYALLFGIFFVFANPPFQGPDEIRHAFRSYQVSEALPRSAPIPQSLVTVHSQFEFLPFRPANKTGLDQLLAAWKVPLQPEHRNFHGSTGTSFFPNLPQGLGMFLGRQLGLPAVGLMYMGRLFNLFFWIVLVYLAIRQLPFYRWVFFFAALSPMGLYQAASLSYDGFTNGMCFLLISTFLSFGYGSGVVRLAKLAAMVIQGILASLAKFLYFPLVLLYLLIPVRRIGSKVRYGAVFASLLLLSWGVNFLWNLQSGKVGQVLTAGQDYRNGSLSFILGHPWEFLTLVGRTLKGHGAYLEG